MLEFMDFSPLSERICFTSSDDSMEVRVSIAADDIFESASGEIFLLRLRRLSNNVKVNITDSAATITIVEDLCKYGP